MIHAILFTLVGLCILLFILFSLSFLLWAALAVVIAGLIYALGAGTYLRKREGARGEARQAAAGGDTNAEERRELARRLEQQEKELEELRREREEAQRRLRSFAAQCMMVDEGKEAERTLSRVIVEKTENATLELTDHVYSIGESSKRVGALIDDVLGQLIREEGGLGDNVRQIEHELETIKSLIGTFGSIRDGYRHEFDEVKKTLSSIDTFTDTIGDLSERTNILATNASIEAARAGKSGEGFAVIASEVQKLARNSQEIAGQINRSVEDAVAAVSGAVEKYGSQIQDAVGRLEQTGQNHSRLIERLNPEVERLSGVAQESQEISQKVTKNLNEVTVHLQYQDSVRQILEHMVALLEQLSEKGRREAESMEESADVDREQVREEVRTILRGLFTTREEWNAFGYTLEEQLDGDDNHHNQNTYEGDITLF